jgi:hypothetical protein
MKRALQTAVMIFFVLIPVGCGQAKDPAPVPAAAQEGGADVKGLRVDTAYRPHVEVA